MDLLYNRCAGLDVHKKSVSACIRISNGKKTRKETTTFGTFTADLGRLRDWLQEHGVSHVALESTGVFCTGKTAQLMLEGIARGHWDPEKLIKLAQASLKNKRLELRASLNGFYSGHFRWLLAEALQELMQMDRKLEQVDKRLAKQLQPHADLILRLCTIPGVDFTTAAVIVAEIGFDMSRFPDAAHLASWAGLCPGHNESAGKRYSGSTRKATGI